MPVVPGGTGPRDGVAQDARQRLEGSGNSLAIEWAERLSVDALESAALWTVPHATSTEARFVFVHPDEPRARVDVAFIADNEDWATIMIEPRVARCVDVEGEFIFDDEDPDMEEFAYGITRPRRERGIVQEQATTPAPVRRTLQR